MDRPKSAKRLSKRANESPLDFEDNEEEKSEDLSQEFDLMAYGVNKSAAEASIDDNENNDVEDFYDTRRPLGACPERGKISKDQYKESKGYDSLNDKGVSDLFGEFLFTDTVHESTSVIRVKDMGDSFYSKGSSSLGDKSDSTSTHSSSQSSPKKTNQIVPKSSFSNVETSQALSSSYPELRKASGLRVLKEIRERKNLIEKSRSRKTKDSRSDSSLGSGQNTPIVKENDLASSSRPQRRPPAKLKPLMLSHDEIYEDNDNA